ncbi:MAG TPA: ribonuclease HI family protein [Candidatus Parcubacteria bacterium]|nr:ribonuclease HI family protein [Candidatus Parcubacteria bacterium]|tara:strand:- start:16417 stop:16860 length:444 start_codon:yes stop_codon:yes gene_type:complete
MKKLIIYTDGGSRGNPGPSAVGVAIYSNKGEKIKEYSEYLGKTTNNEAEYQALILALKKIKALYGKKEIKKLEVEIKSDSELLINQLGGKYKVIDSKIQLLFLKAWNLKIDYGKVKFSLIPREKNQEADRLLNEVLDSHEGQSSLNL